jgi:hypothetical protein
MGWLERLRRPANHDSDGPSTQTLQPTNVTARLYPGDEDLEVVGEASYQDALWKLCGQPPTGRIRHRILAALVPQPDNPYDSNAISVQIDGNIVGYLPRDVAATYLPGLRSLMAQSRAHVALNGVIVGQGRGRLGVWLEHDPTDFGLPSSDSRQAPGRPQGASGAMRTGFSEAWLTDVEDDSYDLSWFNDLPDADVPAIEQLRELLAVDPDPIDRHFQFAELEGRLYRSRDLFPSALGEYDAACQLHDAEMVAICQAFLTKWGKIPLLETYRQMAIRQQKAKDWEAVIWWTERGLSLYGDNPAREEAVEDLLKRRNRARTKLEPAPKPPRKQAADIEVAASLIADVSSLSPDQDPASGETEVLTCTRCGTRFERLRVRGRKPLLCPDCRGTTT